MSEQQWTRRQVLRAVAMLAAAAGLPVLASCRRARHDAELAALLPAGPGVLLLGRAYLRRFPEERSAALLAERIVAALDGYPGSDGSGSAAGGGRELGERLLRRVRAEHRAGDVIVLRGWTLALVEARLLALCAAGTRQAG